MRADLQTWLDQADPSYPAGLSLLAATGYDQTTLTWNLLQRGADTFTWGKLRGLLSAALVAPSPPVEAVPAPVMVAPTSTKPAIKPAISRLLDERTQAKATLRAWLDDPGRAEERRVLALRIKDITDELDRLYNPDAFVTLVKPAKLLTLANVRTYVSLYRKKTRLEPGNEAYAQKLTHYETLLTQLTHETPL